MFITLTINTNIKNKPAKGWRTAVFTKRRTLWQKIKSWRRSLKPNRYKLGGQVAMF